MVRLDSVAKTPIERAIIWIGASIVGAVITFGIPTIVGVALISWSDLRILKNDVANLASNINSRYVEIERRVSIVENKVDSHITAKGGEGRTP